MAFKSVQSFHGLAQIVTAQVGDFKTNAVKEIFDELIRPGVTPRDTGTLVHSWRAGPSTSGVVPDYMMYPGNPAPFSFQKYKNNWKKFYIWNNQPYLNQVNDMPQYLEFVQGAVVRGSIRANAYNK